MEDETIDLFELTFEQKKAFKNLEAAFKQCEKVGILLSNSYGHCIGVDKKKIRKYDDDDSGILDEGQAMEFEMPSSFGEWADDNHYFHPVKQ